MTDEVNEKQKSQQVPYYTARTKNMNEVMSRNSKNSRPSLLSSHEKAKPVNRPNMLTQDIKRPYHPSTSPIEKSSLAIPPKMGVPNPEPDNLSDSEEDMGVSEYSKSVNVKVIVSRANH